MVQKSSYDSRDQLRSCSHPGQRKAKSSRAEVVTGCFPSRTHKSHVHKCPSAGLSVPGATFRGWKEVTSLFNKDDEQQLLEGRKSPKSRATNLRLKEELKTEKKSGFWDNLVLKQNIQSKKPDEIEGWEPPKLALEDVAADSGGPVSDRVSRPGWQEDTKGSSKYTSLAGAGSSSRWSLRSAGKLVSIRRQSRGHLTDDWEELE
ncbi:hypothetical protein E5288_WYG010905 [Bos mutus]|uniref:Testis development-related protein n=1 Tax=Bos mutus TaxID=72004 RepID=A0A6B0QZP4_9CETA|nr:hypothetical protein [Bos mutus]